MVLVKHYYFVLGGIVPGFFLFDVPFFLEIYVALKYIRIRLHTRSNVTFTFLGQKV